MQNLTNKTYERLTVVECLGKIRQSPHIYWLCICSCGKRKEVSGANLKSGAVKSCGCLQKERAKSVKTTHGLSMDRRGVYSTWLSMHKRCNNTKEKDKTVYMDRGIKVCERWKAFKNFYADMGERPANTSLDRIDNDKGYEPGNCKWSSSVEQARNRRSTVKLTAFGQTKPLAAWAEEHGLHYKCLARRIRLGWNAERALTTPSRSNRTLITNLS